MWNSYKILIFTLILKSINIFNVIYKVCVTMASDLHENVLNWIKFIFWRILSS